MSRKSIVFFVEMASVAIVTFNRLLLGLMRGSVALLSLAPLACGPSEERREHEAAWSRLQPSLDRLGKVHAALPAPGTEQEKSCVAAIPAEGLETMDFSALEYFLGKDDRTGSLDRNRLTTELLRGHPGRPSDEPSRGAIMNAQHRAEEMAAVKSILVFRASEVDPGRISGTKVGDAYPIERPARWRGWGFVYSFEDAPALLAAFPLAATSSDSMTLVVKSGQTPGDHHLLDDVGLTMHKEALERVAKCPAGGAN